LPRLERHAQIYFRHVTCPATRDNRIAGTIAHDWRWFVRLYERGKSIDAFPMAFSFLVARAVKSGRRVTGQSKAKDIRRAVRVPPHGLRTRARHGWTRTTATRTSIGVYLAGPRLGAIAGCVGGFLATLAVQARQALKGLFGPSQKQT
jgi:hypothetical protein